MLMISTCALASCLLMTLLDLSFRGTITSFLLVQISSRSCRMLVITVFAAKAGAVIRSRIGSLATCRVAFHYSIVWLLFERWLACWLRLIAAFVIFPILFVNGGEWLLNWSALVCRLFLWVIMLMMRLLLTVQGLLLLVLLLIVDLEIFGALEVILEMRRGPLGHMTSVILVV